VISEQQKSINIRADWRETLKIGDILITPSGDWRIVRDVQYWSDDNWCKSRQGLLGFVDLAIRRCSWTSRAYTTKCRYDIGKWKKLEGVRAKLNTEADKKIYEDIKSKTIASKLHYDCCDAKAFI